MRAMTKGRWRIDNVKFEKLNVKCQIYHSTVRPSVRRVKLITDLRNWSMSNIDRQTLNLEGRKRFLFPDEPFVIRHTSCRIIKNCSTDYCLPWSDGRTDNRICRIKWWNPAIFLSMSNPKSLVQQMNACPCRTDGRSNDIIRHRHLTLSFKIDIFSWHRHSTSSLKVCQLVEMPQVNEWNLIVPADVEWAMAKGQCWINYTYFFL